jgi:hypothetical protein
VPRIYETLAGLFHGYTFQKIVPGASGSFVCAGSASGKKRKKAIKDKFINAGLFC